MWRGQQQACWHDRLMDLWQAAAANNAKWCDLIARSHGLSTCADAQAWTCQSRPPPLYPDAVTLVRCLSVPDLLGRVDASPGCSVKDSFAALDLGPYGFRILFEADWIARPAADPMMTSGPGWRRIVEPAGLARWQDAWRPDGGPGDLFGASILDHDWVAVLAAEQDDQIIAGAIVTCGPVVAGISNFFACPGAAPEPWPGCLAMASSLFPGRAVVGYESGDELIRAERHGFQRIGRLRVWVSDPSPPA
jgi:hypothetical protein